MPAILWQQVRVGVHLQKPRPKVLVDHKVVPEAVLCCASPGGAGSPSARVALPGLVAALSCEHAPKQFEDMAATIPSVQAVSCAEQCVDDDLVHAREQVAPNVHTYSGQVLVEIPAKAAGVADLWSCWSSL